VGESEGCGGSNLRCIHFLNTCTLYMTDDRYSSTRTCLLNLQKSTSYTAHMCVY
jgi:hypothetical protein